MSCTEPPPPIEPIKLAVQTVWPSYGTAFIAQEKGLFAKYGVQVEFVTNEGYVENLTAYKTKDVDGTFTVFADAIMLDAEGISSRVVYVTEHSDTADLIVGNPNLKSLKDLKDKTISFHGFNTFSHLFVIKSLERVGIQEGEFKIANMTDEKVIQALDNGEIDAAHVWEPIASQAQAKGYKILAKGGDIPNLMVGVLIFKASVVEKRPEAVQSVVNAINEAMHILRDTPDVGIPIIAKYSSLSEAEVAATLKELHLFTLAENKEILQQNGRLFKAGVEIADFFLQKGGIVRIPKVDKLIDNRFVETIQTK
jgi:NitT/TauT family transport system substrate-binding protein